MGMMKFDETFSRKGGPLRHRALLQYVLLSMSIHPNINDLAPSLTWHTWLLSILHRKLTGGMTVLILLFSVVEESEEVFSLNSSFLCVCLGKSVIAAVSQTCAQDLEEKQGIKLGWFSEMTGVLWLMTDSKVDEVKSSAVARNKPPESPIYKLLSSSSVLILTSGLWQLWRMLAFAFFWSSKWAAVWLHLLSLSLFLTSHL